jgi:hypothetical protein
MSESSPTRTLAPAAGPGHRHPSAGIASMPASIWPSTSAAPTSPILPGGASGLLLRDYKRKEADTLVDPGVVSLVAELRGNEREAAQELEQWRTHLEERKLVDA